MYLYVYILYMYVCVCKFFCSREKYLLFGKSWLNYMKMKCVLKWMKKGEDALCCV